MKLQIISDIHLEVSDMTYEQVLGREDRKDTILIIAGDLTSFKDYKRTHEVNHKHLNNYIDFVEKASSDYCHVVMIPGNHDFWGMNLDIDAAREVGGQYWDTIGLEMVYGDQRCFKTQMMDPIRHLPNVHYLVRGDAFMYGEFMFIGATMWTDLKKGNPTVRLLVERGMNDFRRSNVWREGKEHSYRADDWLALHEADKNAQAVALKVAKENGKRVIVINHHAPSWQSRMGDQRVCEITYAYVNDSEILNDLNSDVIELIVHGHTHQFFDYTLQGSDIRVVCNPFGYQGSGMSQLTGYRPNFIVEIR